MQRFTAPPTGKVAWGFFMNERILTAAEKALDQ